MSAVAGLELVDLDGTGRLGQRAAELRVGHRPERRGRRRAQPAGSRSRPPAGGRRRADHLQVRFDGAADHDARRRESRRQARPREAARDWPSRTLSPRIERVPGVAAVSVEGGLRRQIRVELSKEKITRARPVGRSRGRACCAPRTRTSRSARSPRATRPICSAARGSSPTSTEIRNLVVMTRNGVPVYLRDIADVKDTTEDVRSLNRINGKPTASACASPSSRARTRWRSPTAVRAGDRAHQPRGAGPQAVRPRRQLGVHQALDRRRSRERRADRRASWSS